MLLSNFLNSTSHNIHNITHISIFLFINFNAMHSIVLVSFHIRMGQKFYSLIYSSYWHLYKNIKNLFKKNCTFYFALTNCFKDSKLVLALYHSYGNDQKYVKKKTICSLDQTFSANDSFAQRHCLLLTNSRFLIHTLLYLSTKSTGHTLHPIPTHSFVFVCILVDIGSLMAFN